MNTATLKPVKNTGLGNELEGVSTSNIIYALGAVNYSLKMFIQDSVMDVSAHEEREALSGLSIAGHILSDVLANRSLCGQLQDDAS